jgi:hypothetical protein
MALPWHDDDRDTSMNGRARRRWRLALRVLAPAALMLMAAAPVESPSLERQLGAAATLVDNNRAAEALAILDAMLPTTELPLERGKIEALRSFALARQGRLPEARKAIEAGIASNPAPSLLLLRQLFLLRAFDGDPTGAADTLQLIAASDPAGLAQLPTEVVSQVMRGISKDEARAFDVDYSLVAAGWQPADATLADVDWLRLRLITGLVRRGRLDDARPILDQVLNPVVLVRLGIDRRFQALWPAIEARLGPGADIADAGYVGAAKARFDKALLDRAPTSLVARLGYAEALNIASREAEAMGVADVARTPAELAALSDREIWLVNLHAVLLGDAGRIDAAMARYAALNATPIAPHPALIGTIINEALFAESVDRPRDALAAIDRAMAQGRFTNDFGNLYLAQVRSCALGQLGDKAAAATAAAPLIAKPTENDDAYLAAMLCLGRIDDAAAAVLRRLASDEDRTEMLFELQPFLINDKTKLRDARARAGMRALKARPDVKAAYAKAGRDLPAAVAPPR